MTRILTSRQERLLTYIKDMVIKLGHPPSLYEMAHAMGGITVKAVKDHLAALEKKGYLRRTPGKRRAIVLIEDLDRPEEIPVIGRVVAGMPILAEEYREGALPINAKHFGEGVYFALRVRGDSMIGLGIREGDYVIVRKQETAQSGDIVVALLGDEATVKVLRRRRKEVFLEAANPAYPDIPLGDRGHGIKILGRVVGLYREIR